MSLTNPLPRGTRQVTPDYVADGTNPTFPIPFWFVDPRDIAIFTADPVALVYTRKGLNVDYTITGAGVPGGGSATFATAPAAGQLVRVMGLRTPNRTTSVVLNGVVQSGPIETEFDVVEATLQELRRDVDVFGAQTADFQAAVVAAEAAAAAAELFAAAAAAAGSNALLRGYPNVDATGGRDTTAAIQAALNAFGAAGGGVLGVGAGTFLISTITIPAGVKLIGWGRDVTIFKRLPSALPAANALLTMVQIGGDGAWLTSCMVDCNSPPFGAYIVGVEPMQASSDVNLYDVHVKDPSFTGIYWHNNGGAWAHARIDINKCRVTNAGWEGVQVAGVSDGYLRFCSIESTGYYAVDLQSLAIFDCVHNSITKATPPTQIYHGPGQPYAGASADAVTVGTGSKTFPNATAGTPWVVGEWVWIVAGGAPTNYMGGNITAYAGSNLVVDVTVTGGFGSHGAGGGDAWVIVAETGFLIGHDPLSSALTIAFNKCVDNRNACSDGIGYSEAHGVEFGDRRIEGNYVYRAGLFGIDMASNTKCVGNHVEQASQTGIYIGSDLGDLIRDVTITGNTIRDSGTALNAGQGIRFGRVAHLYTPTISTTNGSTAATVSSAANLMNGMWVVSANVPGGASIVSADPQTTSITLSAAATATASATAATVCWPNFFENISIDGNVVEDIAVPSYTLYALAVDYFACVYYAVSVTNNVFAQINGPISIIGFGDNRPEPSLRFHNNVLQGLTQDDDARFVSAASGSFSVFGYENFTISDTGATTLSSITGGYNGQRINVVFANGNTTLQFDWTNTSGFGVNRLIGNSNAGYTAQGGDMMTAIQRENGWACQLIKR